MYEKKKLKVDIKLISQYLQDEGAARDFAIYYDLFCKYQDDYQVESILRGNVQQEVKARAINAAFDERLLLISLLLSVLDNQAGVLRVAVKACDIELVFRLVLVLGVVHQPVERIPAKDLGLFGVGSVV